MHLPGNQLAVWCLSVILSGASCTTELPPSTNDVEPDSGSLLWSVRLPGDAGIYNEGMIGLPVVDKRVLFHSTMFTDQTNEDNRLHALDVESGEIKWTFPDHFDAGEPYCFDGKPYVYESVLVTKMSAFGPYCGNDRILILDLSSGKQRSLIHLPMALSRFTCRDVAGKGSQVWFIQEDEQASYVYKLDIPRGDTTRIACIASRHPYGRLEVTTRELQLHELDGELYLLVGVADYAPAYTGLGIMLVNAETGAIRYQKSVKRDYNLNVNYVSMRNSMIYYTCGRSAGCIDVEKDDFRWYFFSQVALDYMKPGLIVQDSIVFLWGHRVCASLSADTGRLLYEKQIECANVRGLSPYLFIVQHNGEAVIADQHTGNIVQTFSISSGSDKNGFSTACKPGVDGKKLFLFGLHNAYCYTY
jgi:hypothetical protein